MSACEDWLPLCQDHQLSGLAGLFAPGMPFLRFESARLLSLQEQPHLQQQID